MALHFETDEYAARLERLRARMQANKLDAMMLFAPESHYWLTGYDTFGFCFFQCLVVTSAGEMALLTRSADMRQARHTSNIETVVIWGDRAGANPARDLKDLTDQFDLLGKRIGVEYATQGLTAANGRMLDAQFAAYAEMIDASDIIPQLRAVKSPAELAFIRKAGELADEALLAARPLIRSGADEGDILAAMHGAIFSGGGDYAGNEFIIGSGDDALLCRYKSGRRKLARKDQLTLEWAGTWRHYHAALMRTIVIGKPDPRQIQLHEASRAALQAVEDAMRIGQTFGDVFEAHRKVMDEAGLARHRLNACGYSLGAHYAPCWMDAPMFYDANPAVIEENMSLFAHMIIMDSDSGKAMCLGRTYLTTRDGPVSVSALDLDLIVA